MDNRQAHILTMTAYPPGNGPYERWELTVDRTGELLVLGEFPLDHDAIRAACAAYRKREGLNN
jgi:hypothetical protein